MKKPPEGGASSARTLIDFTTDKPSSLSPALNHKRRSFAAAVCSRLRSGTEGAAMAEFMITVPFVMVFLAGIFSFSITLSQKLLLSEAVANGGRVLAVERGDTNPCAKVKSAIYAATPSLDHSLMTISFTINDVSYGTGVTTCPGPNSGPNEDMVAGQTAHVIVTYPASIEIMNKQLVSYTMVSQISEVIQ
jgi:Flp pilus assembly protein TadG